MSKFKVRCIKSRDNRFTVGRIYTADKNGYITDNHGDKGMARGNDFKEWYIKCGWINYDFEEIKDYNKIVITSDGYTTTAKLYDGKTVVKSAEAKCSPDDKFDFVIGANLAYDRLMRPETLCKTEKPVDQPAEYYNGKVVCIKAGSYHTAGKVYEVKNGVVNCDYDDSGEFTYNISAPVKTLEQLNANSPVQFIEFKGEVTND